MLAFTLICLSFAAFFTILYLQLGKENKEYREKNEDSPAPFIQHVTKNTCLILAVICLFNSYYFAMMGEPTVLITDSNASCGTQELSSYGYTNMTSEEIVFACSTGSMNWSAYPEIVCNDQLATLSSEYHLRINPVKTSDSLNTTNVYGCSSAKTEATGFTNGQMTIISFTFNLMQQLALAFALMFGVLYLVRWFKQMGEDWKRKQGGDYE